MIYPGRSFACSASLANRSLIRIAAVRTEVDVFPVRFLRNGSTFPHCSSGTHTGQPAKFLGLQNSMIVAINVSHWFRRFMFVVVGRPTIEPVALTTASRTDSARNQIDAACLAAPYRSHMISSTWSSPSLPAVANEPFLSAETFG